MMIIPDNDELKELGKTKSTWLDENFVEYAFCVNCEKAEKDKNGNLYCLEKEQLIKDENGTCANFRLEPNQIKQRLKTSSLSDKQEEIFNQCLDFDRKGKIRGVNIQRVAEYFCNEHFFRTLFFTNGNSLLYVYKNGFWSKGGKGLIVRELEQIFKEYVTNKVRNEVLNKIESKTAISPEDFFKTHQELLNLENGVLNITTKELEPHNPDLFFLHKLPVKYDPNADCKLTKKFLKGALYKQDFKVVQEWYGYCLLKNYNYKKALVCLGYTDTSKSVFINHFIRFFGHDLVAGLSLHEISRAKSFDLLQLKDRMLNVYDDLGSKDITTTGGFKIATGRGIIRGEIKFGDSVNFTNHAKLMFATNKIPLPKDSDVDDSAYYNRWLLILFDNQVAKEKQDKQLLEKLTTEGELSGVLNFALEGLDRLKKNNCFSYKLKADDVKDLMHRSGHPLQDFVDNELYHKSENIVSKEKLYMHYKKWCVDNKKAILSKNKLTRNLQRFCTYARQGRDGQHGRKWVNVGIKGKKAELEIEQETITGERELKKIEKTNFPCSNCGETPSKYLDDRSNFYCKKCGGD